MFAAAPIVADGKDAKADNSAVAMDQPPAPQLAPAPAPAADSKRSSGNSAQEAFNSKIRAHFGKGKRVSGLDIRFCPPSTTCLSQERTALDWCVKPVTVWVPHRTWESSFEGHLPCPIVGCTAKTRSKGLADEPRLIQCLEDVEFLWSSRHICPQHKGFQASDAAALERMPSFVRAAFPCVLTEKSAVSNQYALVFLQGFSRLLKQAGSNGGLCPLSKRRHSVVRPYRQRATLRFILRQNAHMLCSMEQTCWSSCFQLSCLHSRIPRTRCLLFLD